MYFIKSNIVLLNFSNFIITVDKSSTEHSCKGLFYFKFLSLRLGVSVYVNKPLHGSCVCLDVCTEM